MIPDFTKANGLLPAVIQDSITQKVLMVGFMDEAAYRKTLSENKVTFFSRSKQRLWTKGETSGHYLNIVSMALDCDNDTLLIQAIPCGPACHTGSYSCFGESHGSKGTLYRLQEIISERIATGAPDSYTARLYGRGINKMAQKVGEEAVELVIEAKDNNTQLFVNEAADLLYHLLLLLRAKDVRLEAVEEVLAQRMAE